MTPKTGMKSYRTALVALPIILIIGFVAWLFYATLGESDAQTTLQTAVVTAPDDSQPEAVPGTQPNTIEPLGHLRILRQSFARGGLGSKALVTFTLRNDNDFAVKDPEIQCSFRSRDGRYTTERRRTISDTVNMKSRKTYPYILVGFVNIKASMAKCSVLAASRA
jgi:hypothetical protein